MGINLSLARGIRRGYLRRLDEEWMRFRACSQRDIRRNRYLDSSTPKAHRRSCQQLVSWFSPLMPSAQLRVPGAAREAFVLFGLKPELDKVALGAGDAMHVTADCLLRPQADFRQRLPVRICGHAIDRVIQRAGVVSTPISDSDMEAIHAEFADLLSYVPAVLSTLAFLPRRDADGLNVLIPSHHGFFLGGLDDSKTLAIKTFVDSDRLIECERQALVALGRIGEATLALHAVNYLARGWFSQPDQALMRQLSEIWRQFGWRLAAGELPAGLSDRAWARRSA